MEKPEEAIAISDACRSTHRAGRPTIYLLGDSHMSQFGTAIEAWAKQHRLNLAMVTGNGCLFPAAVIRGDEVACFERQRRIEKTLIGVLRQGDLVFIGNALFARFVPGWSEQPEAYKDADRRSIDSRTAANLYSARVQALSDQLNRLGAKVVFYSDGVQFAALDKLPGSLCRREWFRPAALVAKACTQSLHTHQLEMDRRFGWRHAWQDKRHRFSWDATRYRRDCDGDVCRATSYHDSNHFNGAYAAAVFHGFAADHPQLLSQDAVRR